MDKRYQVFVSSTFEDLQDERKAVMQALLEIDCIPAGMELFPASNEEQWALIQRVIDDSDYYVLILGGRYGSCNDEGIGYTEMEYRYALRTNKPIISFLHRNPSQIPSGKSEQMPDGKKKLEDFREFVKRKIVKTWCNPDDLAGKVTTSVISLKKNFPAVGWVKADQVLGADKIQQLYQLQEENAKLKKSLMDLEELHSKAPEGSQDLAQGDDLTQISVSYHLCYAGDILSEKFIKKINISWNEIFKFTAPELQWGCSEEMIVHSLERGLEAFLENYIEHPEGNDITCVGVRNVDLQKILIQFRGLGLIAGMGKKGWVLTRHGVTVMIREIAEKKSELGCAQ